MASSLGRVRRVSPCRLTATRASCSCFLRCGPPVANQGGHTFLAVQRPASQRGCKPRVFGWEGSAPSDGTDRRWCNRQHDGLLIRFSRFESWVASKGVFVQWSGRLSFKEVTRVRSPHALHVEAPVRPVKRRTGASWSLSPPGARKAPRWRPEARSRQPCPGRR